jgi:hypothetical protein
LRRLRGVGQLERVALLFRVAALAAACLISTGALAATIVLRGATVLDMTGAPPRRELLLLEEAGIPRAEVLRIATRNAAIALHRESEMGTIEPGKMADLVVLSKDPLADLHNTRQIDRVMQRGREVDRAALLARR